MSRRSSVLALVFALGGTFATQASAQDYQAAPWTFVGTVADCGVSGNKIVTSTWLGGLGLPDNGASLPSGKNADNGLLLNKNGLTSNCSSAGAEIKEAPSGWIPKPLAGLGFDFRLGGHCGAGAPRFNVYTQADFSEYFFFGCASGVHSPAPQNAGEWERVRFGDADAACAVCTITGPFTFGVTTVYAVEVVFDEGTDAGVGLATIDNILIDTTLIRKKGNNAITP